MTSLFSFELTYAQVAVFILVALCIGMSKTGVHGTGMVAVPMLASIFGGQLSSGIMLPILCIADVMGVWYYHRHASWHHLRKLFPWAALGTILGTLAGGYMDDAAFKMVMAIIIVVSVVIMIWLEQGHREDVPGLSLVCSTYRSSGWVHFHDWKSCWICNGDLLSLDAPS